MTITELMKLIPDDGELSFKNNSGQIIMTVSYYGYEYSEVHDSRRFDYPDGGDWLKYRIKLAVTACFEKYKSNANS